MSFHRYYWTKDGISLELSDKIALGRKGNLIFSDSLPDDEGIYQCFAENTGGIAVSAKVNVVRVCEYHTCVFQHFLCRWFRISLLSLLLTSYFRIFPN